MRSGTQSVSDWHNDRQKFSGEVFNGTFKGC